MHGCLLVSIAVVQEENRKVVFIFTGDANTQHSEWLQSISPTDRHGIHALDFCNLSECEQLIRVPTHVRGNRPDLAMTNAPGVVEVSIGSPVGSLDLCFVGCILSVEQFMHVHNVT